MLRGRRLYGDRPYVGRLTGSNANATAEATGYGWRREDRDVARQGAKRSERQVIRVSVRKQDRVEPRQLGEWDPGRRDPAEDAREPPIEIRIREHAHAADLDQQRGVPDVGYPRAGATFGAVADFARSFDRNHCCGNVARFCTA